MGGAVGLVVGQRGPAEGDRAPVAVEGVGEEADELAARDPHWRDLLSLHEHFHPESGRGLGATHQTGWTALVLWMLGERAGEP